MPIPLPTRIRGFLLATLALLMHGAVSARADAPVQDPLAFIQAAVSETMAVAYAESASGPLVDRLQPTLERFFTFEGLTRRAIGPTWRTFTPEQQRRTLELFTRVVLRSYADKFDPSIRPEIRYSASSDLGRGRHEVASTISFSGSNYSVTYRLEPGDGSWKVYDVIIEGVSMVANYRAQFDSLINRGGAPAVIRSLEDSLREKTS